MLAPLARLAAGDTAPETLPTVLAALLMIRIDAIWLATHGGGLRVAYAVPAGCYLYLLFYALSGYRVR